MGMQNICILDYGSGNVKSVFNSVRKLGYPVKISNHPADIENASHLILPGVGSYGKAMEKINRTLPLEVVTEQVKKGKPILGICVGMQVFSTKGFEYGEWEGLNFLKNSKVEELKTSLPKPHMGWNSIKLKQDHKLLARISNGTDFYFVHSFIFSTISINEVIATCEYSENFPAIVGANNVIGVQFHPEKSQASGSKFLENFCNWLI